MFKKAVKHDAKLRLALCGPAGSGKTYTLLTIATELVGSAAKIALVDTEHGSASKYADLFNFDVVEPEVFDPRELVKTIRMAADQGYAAIGVDSLSHYWSGKGGELDLVDNVAKRSTSGNSFAAWKTVTPYHNELVDTIIALPIHVFVTMRTKTEWVIEKDDRGKSVPRKVGLAPIMRDGIEFEFDVCGDMDQENTLTISKSRCPQLANQIINRPGKTMATTLRAWLVGSASAPERLVAPPMTNDEYPAKLVDHHVPPAQTPPAPPQSAGRTSAPKDHKVWQPNFLRHMDDFAVKLGRPIFAEVLRMFTITVDGERCKLDDPSLVTDREQAKQIFQAMEGAVKNPAQFAKPKPAAASIPESAAEAEAKLVDADAKKDWLPEGFGEGQAAA